jgi:molybdopterin converting factor small subunit
MMIGHNYVEQSTTHRKDELRGLDPLPEDEWKRLERFLGLGVADRAAMLATVEALFRRGHELVVGNYDYLLQNHETAAILGWEKGADPEHLEERRRFFTVWLARTLGLDMSADFARYLFKAGQMHAAHGPRAVHVPEVYVTGAISLVNSTFARFLAEEMPGAEVIPQALAGWNKYLSMHLHMMSLGYQAARALDTGEFALPVTFYGRLRPLMGRKGLDIYARQGSQVIEVLNKLFNYAPHLRAEVFDTRWWEAERLDSVGNPWSVVEAAYRFKNGWRLLLNGRNVEYTGGFDQVVSAGDQMMVFPPGR